MEEHNVLSPDEVDAIIKAAQATGSEVDGAASDEQGENAGNINTHALANIIENLRNEIETKLTVLLRKKITVKLATPTLTKIQDRLKETAEGAVGSSFKIDPYDSPALIYSEHKFLDNIINLLYGGKLQAEESQQAPLGKIGLITAEKMHDMLVECVAEAGKEYGALAFKSYKTAANLVTINNIPDDESIYYADIKIVIEDSESSVGLYLTEELLIKLIPVKTGKGRHREKDFWRTAIKSEVVDSYVTVTTCISDVQIKLKDFVQLKEGDELQINDPTLVYICLNNLKLYRGLAGQSNSKMVAKIVGQI